MNLRHAELHVKRLAQPRTGYQGYLLLVLVQCLLVTGCATQTGGGGRDSGETSRPKLQRGQYEVFGRVYQVMDDNLGYLEIGVASWYGRKFHGRLTAMGEIYDMYGMTAAHKSLPLPTVVKVTNLDNGRSIQIRVNDRGPFHDDRLIDLSYAAAKALGFEDKGVAPVVVEAVDEVNHPELALQSHEENYYLQAGAFQRKLGAEARLREVQEVLPADVESRILISETETSILYKVWIGPIVSLEQEELVEARLRDRNLAKPVKVMVD